MTTIVSGAPVVDGEIQATHFKMVGKDNTEVWLSTSYHPVFDIYGEIFAILAFGINSTVNKKRKASLERKAALVRDFDNLVKSMVVNTVSSSAGDMKYTAQSLAAAAEQTTRQSSVVSVVSEELSAWGTEISWQLSVATIIAERAVSALSNREL